LVNLDLPICICSYAFCYNILPTLKRTLRNKSKNKNWIIKNKIENFNA
jgi:mannose/fructose/N-acetylgalactosamine-specific phosphotransferase system component IID